MNITLNNKVYVVEEKTTLAVFIEQMGQKSQGIAVAIGDKVIPKAEWDSTLLTENMELILIHAVSGG